LPFRVGDTYSDEQGAAAIRALFGLGLFSDVRLQVDGDVLVVIVEERPTVADVSFTGIKEFDKDVLRKALRDIGLTEGRPFDRSLADPRRAGTQAPIPQPQYVCGAGDHHRHADRAQPRQPQFQRGRG
jgi:outer membrane protein assembly factor BamA